MFKQEVFQKAVLVPIMIPETKRLYFPSQNTSIGFSSNTPFALQFFESYKIQIQQSKPQLGLRAEKSGFTKVSSSQDDENLMGQSNQNEQNKESFENYYEQLKVFMSLYINDEKEDFKGSKQYALNTKNILRNLCNAQNQFILFNSKADQIIQNITTRGAQFKAWVNKLRFHTFEQFQSVWSLKRKHLFSKLYKRLCRKFYTQNAIPYIMNSRIKNRQTKLSHLRYLYRFLEGLDNPAIFYYFKQKQKEKA